mgnify:CR=1 FL=1
MLSPNFSSTQNWYSEIVSKEDIDNLQEENILSLPTIREIISKMRKEEVIQILKNYVREEFINKIEENVNLTDFTSFLLWLNSIMKALNIYSRRVSFPR